MQLSLDQATGLCRMAALGAGAGEEAARVLAAATVAAEAEGYTSVGLSHFIDYLESIELSDEEFLETKALVDRLYNAYTDFVAEMYDWVQTHNLQDLRQSQFFSERVSGQVSRPMNAEELLLHRTPVAASSHAE